MGKLYISSQKTFVVNKSLDYVDESLDPEKTRSNSGDYMKIQVLNPVYITITEGGRFYTDDDVRVGSAKAEGETIESILKWPTIKNFIRKRIIMVASDIIDPNDQNDSDEKIPSPKPKKAKPVVTSFADLDKVEE